VSWLYKARWLLRGSDTLHERPNGVIGQASNTTSSPTGCIHVGLPTRDCGGSHDELLQMPGDGC
jgi:hypothetical protein